MRGTIRYLSSGFAHYYFGGLRVTEAEFRLRFPAHPKFLEAAPGGHLPGGWPLYSDGAGINPEHAEAAMEADRAKGVPTDYDKEGRAILRDRGHRRAYLKAHNLHDKHGGYGD